MQAVKTTQHVLTNTANTSHLHMSVQQNAAVGLELILTHAATVERLRVELEAVAHNGSGFSATVRLAV